MEPLQVADFASTDAFAPGAPQSERIIKEKIPAASDTDTSTKQTIAKMCEYRRAAGSDPLIKEWAKRAHQAYGLNSPDPRAKAWAAFWHVKHSLAFASDEPRLFSVGEPNALDLLIAPAVLVRQEHPKGDCDDFTMLLQALLDQLGIESYTVTVAADPSDPSRWSHVFSVAKLPDGTLCAMDASHGEYPGWMVPREHIFRWQAWDSAGNTANVPMPLKKGLHGYIPTGLGRRPFLLRRRGIRGMGQDDSGDGGDTTITLPDVPTTPPFSIDTGGGSSTPSTPSTPINWGSLISSIGTAVSKDFTALNLPAGYVMGANGQPVYTGTAVAGAQLTSTISGLLPILVIGFLAVALIGGLEGGKR